jgi:hypothetical protein
MAGTNASAASTGRPVARPIAGSASPAGRNRVTVGIAPTIDRMRRPTNPTPAAAAADPVTVLARNVIAAHTATPSQARTAMAAQPAIGIGSNRIAV